MRLATVRTPQGTRAARLEGDQLVPLRSRDVTELLGLVDPRAGADDVVGEPIPLAGADFAPVTPRPTAVICVGLNYRAHVMETGRELPAYPTLFTKFAATLIGAFDNLVLPPASTSVDWEVELGVVIGARVRRATAEEARRAIGGYTVINDISVRDWQYHTTQWLPGKAFEATTPVGPFLVTPDELDASDLEVRCEVDGEEMQKSNTADLLFTPEQIISYVSQFMTLQPGDLIATGTPAGVGAARQPPRFLRAGEVLRTSIDGLGACVNLCVDEPPTA
jgi:acylpyruvate hydrolase